MTASSTPARGARPIRRDPSTHLFAIGQVVRLNGGFGLSGTYRITGVLPPRGGSPQYRIRSDEERHERVTTQDNLEPVNTTQPGEGATLIKRTFSHAEGAKAQQSRDPETEAGEGAASA